MASDLTKVSSRSKLSRDRTDPVTHPLAKGQHLLFRPSSQSWGVRWVNSEGQRQFKWFGDLPDAPEHAKFDMAKNLAQTYLNKLGGGSDRRRASYTVLDAVNDYVDHLDVTGGNALDARSRAKRHIHDSPIRHKLLIELTSSDVTKWRRSISTRQVRDEVSGKMVSAPKSPATINRDIVLLKSALNLAFDNGLVHSQAAWRGALKPASIPPDQGRRKNYFTKEHRQALLAAIDRPDVRLLVEFLCQIPLRPSAAARLRTADLDPIRKNIRVLGDKNHGERFIKLPDDLFAWLLKLAAGKGPNQYVFGSGDVPLNKDSWKKLIKKAARQAGLPPNSVLYDIRHSGITDLLVANAPLSLVAKVSGTSERMIQQTYSQILQTEESRSALMTLSLTK